MVSYPRRLKGYQKFFLMIIGFLLVAPLSGFLIELAGVPVIIGIAGLLLFIFAPKEQVGVYETGRPKYRTKIWYIIFALILVVYGGISFFGLYQNEIADFGVSAIGVLLVLLVILGDRDISVSFPRTPY